MIFCKRRVCFPYATSMALTTYNFSPSKLSAVIGENVTIVLGSWVIVVVAGRTHYVNVVWNTTHASSALWCGTEQNRLYLPNQNTAIMNKNSKYKWQATRRASCPSKLAALDIAISLISVVTRKERKKDRNNISKVHSASATLYCYSVIFLWNKR